MPGDGIAVIGRELVMEVVVAFSEGDDGSDEMITGRVAVVEWLVSEPVSKRVDAEGCLLDDEDSENSSVDEAAHPVTPSEAADEHREDHAHGDHGLDVVAVLPDDNRVLVEIGDVGTADTLGVLLHDHPAEMRVHEALANGVWVLVGIGVSVMSTVVPRPPSDGALYGTATHGSEEDLEGSCCRVRAMSPEAMVTYIMLVGCSTRTNFNANQLTSGNSETRHEVVGKGPESRLPLQRSPVCQDHAVQRDANDHDNIEPVDVLVPIGSGHGLLGDVRLLRVILWVADRLRRGGHGRRLLISRVRWFCHCRFEYRHSGEGRKESKRSAGPRDLYTPGS